MASMMNRFVIVAFLSGLSASSLPAAPATGEAAAGVNLAAVATPSASYVSGDTTPAALNDGVDPKNSRDNRHGSYGNWDHTGTQWVQYDWAQPISTREIAVYWWADGRGIKLPKACRVLYWDTKGFVPVANPSGLGVEGTRYNVTTFDGSATPKI